MSDLFVDETGKKRFDAVFVIGIAIGLVLIGAAIFLLTRKPSIEDQTAAVVSNAYHEGSPEFADLSKEIIIATDEDNTVQSPMGLGTISMFIGGKIRNKGTRTITALEIEVSVITEFNEVLKKRRKVVVPVQKDVLAPGETIPVTLSIDGFSKDDDRANIRWKVTAISAQ